MLFFVAPEAMSKFMKQIEHSTQRFRKNPKDAFDTEYICVDKLLFLYMEQFKIAR